MIPLASAANNQPIWVALRLDLTQGPVHLHLDGSEQCPGQQTCTVVSAAYYDANDWSVATGTGSVSGVYVSAKAEGLVSQDIGVPFSEVLPQLFDSEPPGWSVSWNSTFESTNFDSVVIYLIFGSPSAEIANLSVQPASAVLSERVGFESRVIFLRDFDGTGSILLAGGTTGVLLHHSIDAREGLLGLFSPTEGIADSADVVVKPDFTRDDGVRACNLPAAHIGPGSALCNLDVGPGMWTASVVMSQSAGNLWLDFPALVIVDTAPV